MTLATVVILVTVALILAFLAESMVEYLFGTPMDHIPALKPYRWLLMYIAVAVGIFFTLYWKIDLVAIIANGVAGLAGVAFVWKVSLVGQVLSGLIIGRGSNYLHDFLLKFLKKPELPTSS